jgi:hypothetical protein
VSDFVRKTEQSKEDTSAKLLRAQDELVKATRENESLLA